MCPLSQLSAVLRNHSGSCLGFLLCPGHFSSQLFCDHGWTQQSDPLSITQPYGIGTHGTRRHAKVRVKSCEVTSKVWDECVHLTVFLAPCLDHHHSLDRLLLGDQFKAETFFLPYHLSLVLGHIVHLWAWPDGSGHTTRERQGEGVQWDPPPSPPPEVGVCLGLRVPTLPLPCPAFPKPHHPLPA